jgi:hypothetical protein
MAGNFLKSIFKKSKREDKGYSSSEYSHSDYSYAAPKTNRFSAGKLRISKSTLSILAVVVLAVLGFAFWFKSASDNIKPTAQASANSEQISPPYATQYLNREFTFPLKNEKGTKVSEFKYTIQDAELTKEIVVKGQKQSTIAGRSLLIINLKLKYDGNQKLQVNTRDYIRLIVNDNTAEMMAPGVHNDPVDVQPISTMPTRVGFAINESDKNLKLQIGEIEGEKQIIELQFP